MNTVEPAPAIAPAASAPRPHLGRARRLLRDRGFIVAAIVLLVAATGVRFSVHYLQLHLRKEPVPMRQPFGKAMPAAFDQWVRVADETLLPEIQSELAAQDSLFCSYINAAAVNRTPEELRHEFAQLRYEEQITRLLEYQAKNRKAVLSVGLTYYTGKVDNVDHIAERCYIAGGFDAVDAPETKTWSVGDRPLEVRCMTFEYRASRSAARRNIAYFFQVNGSYESSHWAVRRALQNLFARYGYYAKVELRSDGTTAEESAATMQDFLAAALPRIEDALPDWAQYEDRN